MNRHVAVFVVLVVLLASCEPGHRKSRILPAVPRGAEAVTLKGEPLYITEPTPSVSEKYRRAREEWKADKNDADKLIWYGRWTAYCGRYREAIGIFTRGVGEHPADARMLRHRGHRYITIRQFGRAVDDFEKAFLLAAFSPDEVEPDGMPNAMNIPVSTLKSNIFYHLGLAYYLDGEPEKALEAWTRDRAAFVNDDMTVATLHWIYMTLRELGRDEEAAEALVAVTDSMNVIENQAYHKLCLFYKGEISIDELTGGDYSDIMNDAMLYGLGNWYLYHAGDTATARVYFDRIFAGGSWASFGYIAAEARLSALE